MKRAAIIIGVLGIAASSLAQSNNKPAGQSAPAGQAAAAAPQGKRPPQAKTQPEYDAFNAIKQLTDPAAQEKAANDFAAKFPDSELRILAYQAAMRSYEQANNGDKMIDMAHKVLSYDADDPEALVGLAHALAERTRDSDLDKDQRLEEAKKSAQRALITVDTDVPTVGQPPDRVEAYKGYIRSEAYDVLGKISFDAKAWADAETNFRKSIDALPQQPDPIAIFRLAVALDMQSKYPEAMKYVNQAVDMTKEDTAAGKAARAEKDRLTKLTGGAAPAQTLAPK
ncbi:MAG: hypothetical protein LAO24_20420 [Acidobacteriia bacterium]|nr:hypothetical protein [Terriglobia bacterium]